MLYFEQRPPKTPADVRVSPAAIRRLAALSTIESKNDANQRQETVAAHRAINNILFIGGGMVAEQLPSPGDRVLAQEIMAEVSTSLTQEAGVANFIAFGVMRDGYVSTVDAVNEGVKV